ncbi:hypothetical protein LZ30DRAFT_733289 [Colletotrichum cereale]|nr:hypothetical protein LZ30DRAFT_733289 [Colletotrichum cereale]
MSFRRRGHWGACLAPQIHHHDHYPLWARGPTPPTTSPLAYLHQPCLLGILLVIPRWLVGSRSSPFS